MEQVGTGQILVRFCCFRSRIFLHSRCSWRANVALGSSSGTCSMPDWHSGHTMTTLLFAESVQRWAVLDLCSKQYVFLQPLQWNGRKSVKKHGIKASSGLAVWKRRGSHAFHVAPFSTAVSANVVKLHVKIKIGISFERLVSMMSKSRQQDSVELSENCPAHVTFSKKEIAEGENANTFPIKTLASHFIYIREILTKAVAFLQLGEARSSTC